MNFLILSLLLLGSLTTTPSFAGTKDAEYSAEFSLNKGSGFSNHLLGSKVIRDSMRHVVAQYDFAKDGGAISTITLRGPATAGSNQRPKVVLPKGSIVVGCYIDVITPGTTSASGTMAIGTGAATNDLKAALAAASYSGIVACVPTGTAATSIKLASDSTMTVSIATGAFTAGKWNIHVMYLLSDM